MVETPKDEKLENKNEESSKNEKNNEGFSKKERKKIEKLQEEIEDLKSKVNYWKNEYYRAYADTKNLRNSIEKDYQSAMKYRAEGFIDNLIPILDSFYLALKNEPSDQATKNYLVGFQFLYKNFVSALENEGVKEIIPEVGQKFDAQNMEALDTIEVQEEKEANIIKEVKRKGYKMHDRLIRPAGVVVTIIKKDDKKQDEKKEKKEETIA